MKKIAFWSNSRESSGVTSNLACISVATALKYSYKSILIENHCQKNKLENILMYNRTHYQLKEEFNYQYRQPGICNMIDQLSNGIYHNNVLEKISNVKNDRKYKSNLIKDSSIEILTDSLYYIPNSNVLNTQTFDYNLYGSIKNILQVLDIFADITYIDTSYCNNLSTKIILDEADLIVVNFNQNITIINHFFENYSSILSKCVFLISSYHKESSLNLKKIAKAHLINNEYIATIPYNVEYQEAVLRGTIIEFLSRNYCCKRSNPNYNFVQAVKRASYMIMANVELINQKEECL